MKISKIIVVILMILSAFSGLNFISKNVSAINPVLSNYNCSPYSFDIGQEPGGYIHFWVTYTDADNDTPTYVYISRYYAPTYSPQKTMLENNSLDTNYTDGKTYYYDWIYWDFPYLGTVSMRYQTASNSSPIIWQPCNPIGSVTQIPIGEPLKNSGISPANQTTPDNYTFFVQYWSGWNYQPSYVKIVLDNIAYTMTKNDSLDTNALNGINYTYSMNLTAGFHQYTFNTSLTSFPQDRHIGDFYINIQNETDWNRIGIIGIIVSMIIILGAFSFIEIRKKKEEKHGQT